MLAASVEVTMQISGASQIHGAQSISAPHQARPVASPPSGGLQINDQLDLSPAAQFVDQVHSLPDIRQDRVNQLRQQIASGNYDTPDKLDAALNRMLDELA
ncbi:MAG: flagellar biosynthesis anti-sigma factor FlgM [Planctomycetes bacterium]|nr:flagellar biosynthesis anti-sigma factor FlgM [Planctomycetota bacterium]